MIENFRVGSAPKLEGLIAIKIIHNRIRGILLIFNQYISKWGFVNYIILCITIIGSIRNIQI